MTTAPQHPSEGTRRHRPTPVIAGASRTLAAAGVTSARVEAELLAAHVLGIPRGRLALVDGFTDEQLDGYRRLVERRSRREPLQHLTGTAAFRHLELAVGPGVFVPRPETELLAGWGVDQARQVARTGGERAGGRVEPLVVDLCSGSGAVALSVAAEVPQARVVAVERSPEALSWLRRNAAIRVAAGDRQVEVVAADVTDPKLLDGLVGRVDVLLCNPPYVPLVVAVPPEVADHDPAEAVFGGADGLDVIRRVIDRAGFLLSPGGVLGIEHDDSQGTVLPALLAADGRYAGIVDNRDLADRPRFVTASRLADRPPSGAASTWQTDSP
ncbi:peptide chain release factor N(5)-glutamine methyltransferase [Micromonospora sp. HNM0581]|uniref:peptide chain release factor N(5)-glutamine methyltransferase n=1 Tax=Micromonospora sp. HNM0581 TaxID=2716341 RepID=UPI00146AB53D|nr:peptide chain release factor N(5)-glutamine methyltransferase [Micromonospora sp. HNM0581]